MLDGKRCTGVRYSVGGEVREAGAAREVVVSAGTINSPQLLELSGIGQPERLRNLGIEVRQALPGVGENLRDHYAPRTRWLVGKKGITFNDRARGLGMVHQALRYALFRKGFLAAVGGADARLCLLARRFGGAGFVARLGADAHRAGAKGPADRPPVRLHLLRAPDAPGEQGTHPHRCGRSEAAAGDQLQLSVVAARRRADGARDPIARAVMTAPAMAPLQVTEVAPGADRTTDDEIIDWVKSAAETTYHPVGTCKMGSDAMAVVDAQLRVHGIEGLRVADASIMPTLTSGNTNAPSIMIGEKAADMVLAAAA
jgi:choline dehydrogenase